MQLRVNVVVAGKMMLFVLFFMVGFSKVHSNKCNLVKNGEAEQWKCIKELLLQL